MYIFIIWENYLRILLYLHFPGLYPIMWFECVSSHFHPFDPTPLDCTAFLSSQTLGAFLHGDLPACAGMTSTDCRHSREGWAGGPAVLLVRSSCFLHRVWLGTVHLWRQVTDGVFYPNVILFFINISLCSESVWFSATKKNPDANVWQNCLSPVIGTLFLEFVFSRNKNINYTKIQHFKD